MLSRLSIENVAVIERAELEFQSGFNVLTGETGAGKSMIIDALGAVLGERTSKDIVRTGEEIARVSAIFEKISNETLFSLHELGFDPDEDGMFLLQRHITSEGKNVCYINGRAVTVGVLREIGRLLVNTHGQHENQNLLQAEKHVDYLDRLGNHLEDRRQYEQSYHEYCNIHKQLKKLEVSEDEISRRIDILNFQIDEIEKANITIGEEASLTEKCLFYRNSEHISDAIKKANNLLGSDSFEKDSVSQRLSDAVSSLEIIAEQFPAVNSLIENMHSVLAQFDECEDSLDSLTKQLSFDESERDMAEERLSELHRLLSKYGPKEEDILQFYDNCKKELESIEHASESRESLQVELDRAQDIMVDAAEKLTEARKKAAVDFSTKVCDELAFLDMPGVKLEVKFDKAPLTVVGAERVEFCISANPGEPAKSIAKIASGGELSRIMLAIKSVLADVDDIDILIFDEIDNGISGHAAQKVGNKLRQLTTSNVKSRQILCVTHLAQIAAQAHHHLLIKKDVHDNRTFTTVVPLDDMGRRRELARIISGEITSSAMEAADEMLSRYR